MSDQQASQARRDLWVLRNWVDDKSDVEPEELKAVLARLVSGDAELGLLLRALRAGKGVQHELFLETREEEAREFSDTLKALADAAASSRLVSRQIVEELSRTASKIVETTKWEADERQKIVDAIARLQGRGGPKSWRRSLSLAYLNLRLRINEFRLVQSFQERTTFALMMTTLMAFALTVGGLAYALLGSASQVVTAIGAFIGLLMAIASIMLRPKPRRDTGPIDWDLVFRDPPRIKR